MHRTATLTLALVAWTIAARAAAPEPPLGRLPDTVAPTAYRLELTVDPKLQRFSGHTEIDAVLARPTASIFLHGNGLKVTRARVTAGAVSVPARYSQLDSSGVARLDLARTLPAGKLTLEFDYSSAFRSGPEGLFHAKVGNDWYAWTQFEAIDARRMFPGFDEPGFKTPFMVSVTAPAALKVFANSPEMLVTTSGSMSTHHFAPTKPLPTYLVALGVGPFDVVEATIPANAVRHAALPFRVIATKGQLPRMQFAAAEAPKMLALLERYFDTPYPFEKLDFLASPVQAGAMENAGLIIFQDSMILLDKDASARQLRSFGDGSAHEMAHQWVGDLVTPTWWTDLWLNESFAEWMGDKAADEWRPDLGLAVHQLYNAFDAMDLDALGRGRPIHQTIAKNSEIASAFDAITYEKGAQVLSMFESYLGEATFAKGLRLHLSRHRYGNATADDFFQALVDASGNPKIVAALRTFTDQTGIPLVRVSEDAQSIKLSQTRYEPLGMQAEQAQVWMIPLCMARGAARACSLLESATAAIASLPNPGVALIPDAGGTGYYRFSFDELAWDRLIGAAPRLGGREALAVADNLWAAFAAGQIGFDRVISGARAFSANSERLAAIDLADRLQSLADTVLTLEQLPAYRKTMLSIYGPRLASLGTDVSAGAYRGEPLERRALRESLMPLVALEARDPSLRMRLATAATTYLAGAAHALDPAFRSVAFTVALQEGGVSVLRQLKQLLVKSPDPDLRQDATLAIGSSDDATLVPAALSVAVTAGVRAPDAMRLISVLASRPTSRAAATAFAEKNLTRLLSVFPESFRPMLVSMFAGFCERRDAERIDALFGPKLKLLGGGALELAETEERIRLCAALKSSKGAEIAASLAREASRSEATARRTD